MSALESLPYLPSEGAEFVDYMAGVIDGVMQLKSEGRVPDDQGVDDLLALWRTVAARVKADVSAADPTSSKPITTTIPMTQAEWQKSSTMFETLYPLLQILEMRGAINIRASEAVVKVVNAVWKGTLT